MLRQLYLYRVLALMQDCRIRSGSRSEMNSFRIHDLDCQYTQTSTSGRLQGKSPNTSELGWLSAGCPVELSVDSYNAFVVAS